MNELHLKIHSLNFRIGKFSLRDIHLSCRKGEYHVLLGPTGSGKSTLIKCLLGLYHPHTGRLLLNGRDITRRPPERRSMGYLPQSYALFPHLNVEENIRFGLGAGKLSRAEIDRRVAELCGLLQIEALRGRDVRSLSGGERQKVALARALAGRPEVILLDEPFSSIDETSRRMLWFELKQVIKEVGITAIHITHHLEEAYTLGERLSVLINGELVQSGRREEIFQRPASESVARYLNYRNIFPGFAEAHPEGTQINLGHFRIILGERIQAGGQITVCIRPQDIKIIRGGFPIRDSLKRNVFSGEIVSLFLLPESCVMLFKMDGSPHPYDFELKFPAYIKERLQLRVAEKATVAIWESNIIIFNS